MIPRSDRGGQGVTSDEMILSAMPLVRSVAFSVKKRMPANVLIEDLVSIGTVGLLEAARRRELGPEFFFGYAKLRARGAMYDSQRQPGWPRGETWKGVLVKFDEAGPHGPRVAPNQERQFLCGEASRRLEAAVHHLPARWQEILRLYYAEDLTLLQIAGGMGISEKRVSQIVIKALARLRRYLKDVRL